MGRRRNRGWGAWALAGASATIPGAGQLARRRWLDGVLFGLVAGWVHLTLAGLAAGRGAPVSWAWALGAARALGEHHGAHLTTPTLVVFTALAVALHAWSARDALDP